MYFNSMASDRIYKLNNKRKKIIIEEKIKFI